MRVNEATASARRIGPLLALDADGVAVTGETFNGANELLISIAGGAWQAAAGTIGEIGDGYYYYQAPLAEIGAHPFVAVRIDIVCEEFTLREDIEETVHGINVGEPTASKRRIGPLLALDADDVAVTGENFNGAGELEVSINGAAWVAGAGTITEVGDGYYFYEAPLTEVTAHGWIAVKLAGVCEEFTLREDISDGTSSYEAGYAAALALYLAGAASTAAEIEVPDHPDSIDHVVGGLARLPSQFGDDV